MADTESTSRRDVVVFDTAATKQYYRAVISLRRHEANMLTAATTAASVQGFLQSLQPLQQQQQPLAVHMRVSGSGSVQMLLFMQAGRSAEYAQVGQTAAGLVGQCADTLLHAAKSLELWLLMLLDNSSKAMIAAMPTYSVTADVTRQTYIANKCNYIYV